MIVRKTGLKLAALALMVLGLGAFASGCGSDNSSSSSTSSSSAAAPAADTGTKDLEKLVTDAAAAPSTFEGPKDSPPIAKGKFVVHVPCAMAAEGCKRGDAGVRAAAKAAGWKELTIDPAGNPQKQAAAITRAVQLKADAIIMTAIDPTTIKGPLAAAKKAGVVLVGLSTYGKAPLDHDVDLQATNAGKVLGAYVATKSGGKANIGILNDPAYKYDQEEIAGFKDSVSKCSGCKTSFDGKFSFGDLGPTYTSQIAALMRSNSKVDWLAPCCDAAAAPAIPVLAQQGLTNKVKVVSTNGNLQNLGFIADGKQEATVGAPIEWGGWAAIDNVNRVFNKVPVVENDKLPVRLLTKDNVAPYTKTGWKGDLDYEAAYKKLWGVG